jgi:hypothetical protein
MNTVKFLAYIIGLADGLITDYAPARVQRDLSILCNLLLTRRNKVWTREEFILLCSKHGANYFDNLVLSEVADKWEDLTDPTWAYSKRFQKHWRRYFWQDAAPEWHNAVQEFDSWHYRVCRETF